MNVRQYRRILSSRIGERHIVEFDVTDDRIGFGAFVTACINLRFLSERAVRPSVRLVVFTYALDHFEDVTRTSGGFGKVLKVRNEL